jgi:uncharacterized membrane protein
MIITDRMLIHAGVIALSVLFLFFGNRVASGASGGMHGFDDVYDPDYFTGVVTHIIDRFDSSESEWFSGETLIFGVRLTERGRRGENVVAEQFSGDFFLVNERKVAPGDRVLLIYNDFTDQYYFANYVRINYIFVLGIIFFGLILLFARKKGLNAILALGFTCLAIFLVFIPAILSGRNIYAATLIICLFSIVTTLLIVIGPGKKAWAAMLGCLGGVLVAGVLMLAMDILLSLTGGLDRETQSLLLLPIDNPINLRALVFAGVILGAVGAIMDVAMSISASLWELREAGGVTQFKSLLKSGINIGKDIMGTMLNTLILAYIGSSLSLLLLIVVHTASYAELFSMEMIIVEFLRALVGSFGMLMTIPLTAVICGWLYSGCGQLPAGGGDIAPEATADSGGDTRLV